MNLIPHISIADFDYNLPSGKIAQFPLYKRDESKLLVYKDGEISEDIFKNIPDLLPECSLLISNETRVIQARLIFRNDNGANLELFCLEPVYPTRELQQAFEHRSGVVWKCLVGNSRRWKTGKLDKPISKAHQTYLLQAERIEKASGYSLVRFNWEPDDLTFSEVLLLAGITPLPPYIARKANDSDAERYQTIYARSHGSVAAPTAGLHFTESVLNNLNNKKISIEKVVLHVGAGTFKPVSNNDIRCHEMHQERILIRKKTIQKILEKINDPIVVTGTTSMRAIESLFWFGVKLLVDKKPSKIIDIKQWDPYLPVYNCEISARESLLAVLHLMETESLDTIDGQTQLMIVPGYYFRIPNILLTNFHMPKSTLLMLVSAFIGDGWKTAYDFALNHNFRFLSYGDACLFFKS